MREKKVLSGEVMKAKVGELEGKLRGEFSRWMRKELNCSVQGVSWNSRFLVMFKDGYEKYMTSNQLTVVTLEKSPVKK